MIRRPPRSTRTYTLFPYTTLFRSRWLDLFHADCAALNCLPPHAEPSAVEHIPQQIEMIRELIAKGHAYASGDGSVYFRISSFPDYGQLSRLDERELHPGKTRNSRAAGEGRTDSDEYEKDSIADFVLWKARRPEDGDNHWESPWGPGRPGWHLECSAMTRQYLGETFDLHSGGIDLVFPHHENEIAQSRCSCGGEFARHWFHITHLMADGGKMSKSLGNLHTLADLAGKGWTSGELRYVLISGHYRKQLNFTFDSLHASREALGKLAAAREALAEKAEGQDQGISPPDHLGGFEDAWARLNHDLNTPAALGAIFRRLRKSKPLGGEEAAAALAGLDFMLQALGLRFPAPPEPSGIKIPGDIQALAEKRWQARLAKDWPAADALRDEISAKGWRVKDNTGGYEILPDNIP